MKAREILIYLSLKHKGDWKKITDTVKEKKPIDSKEAEEEVRKLDWDCITLLDKEYPESLKNFCQPPYVLYYKGNLSLIGNMGRCVSYIGSRDASEYGLFMANRICAKLAEDGFSIVSGLAIGIDGAAAKASLPFKKAVGVLGCGIDTYYPKSNSKYQRQMKTDGLLISEYPPGVPPRPEHFPARNRIIAALSSITIVGEASNNSGTMITVSQALSMGREVGVVPFRATDKSFCNRLIKDGAPIVECAQDIYDIIGFDDHPKKVEQLSIEGL